LDGAWKHLLRGAIPALGTHPKMAVIIPHFIEKLHRIKKQCQQLDFQAPALLFVIFIIVTP